jgi:membrane-bound lytic murein transglycosylase F
MKIYYFLTLLIFTCPISFAGNNVNELKVLTWHGDSYIPRVGKSADNELVYLNNFAKKHGLTLIKVPVSSIDELIPKLLAGEGDIIAANFTVTPERAEKVAFTQAIGHTTEYLVIGKNAKPIKTANQLEKRSLAIQKGTSFELTSNGLKKAFPGLHIDYIDKSLNQDLLLDKIATNELDATILDSNTLNNVLSYRQDIVKSLQANVKKDTSWAIRSDNIELQKLLNAFIDQYIVPKAKFIEPKNTWQRIVRDKNIRFVMRNNISSYYVWRGKLYGFNYDLAKSFAQEHGLGYEIIVAPDNKSLIDYVIQGKADLAIAFLTPNEYRVNQGVDFTRPYHYTKEVLVGRHDEKEITGLSSNFVGRSIALRASSSYFQTFAERGEDIAGVELKLVEESQDTEDIIEAVAVGKYDLTIADKHIVTLEKNLGVKVKELAELSGDKPQSWALKKGNDELKSKVNLYLNKHYKGLFYNVTYNKYFHNIHRIDTHHDYLNSFIAKGHISPYDEIVKKYSKQFSFDPYLMIAQMYQESRFNPKAESFAGAKGLFQIMPVTMSQLNIQEHDIIDPEIGIKAGIYYLDWVRERMAYYNIQDEQRIWFTLASYNAGVGHVADAIRLAKLLNYREDVWFNNVEKAMLLLSKPQYFERARYGYVRGKEPVNYVRDIKKRYQAYKQTLLSQHIRDSHILFRGAD